jgi:hypothetical protein
MDFWIYPEGLKTGLRRNDNWYKISPTPSLLKRGIILAVSEVSW